jgi:hypothetical protein
MRGGAAAPYLWQLEGPKPRPQAQAEGLLSAASTGPAAMHDGYGYDPIRVLRAVRPYGTVWPSYAIGVIFE